MSFFARPNLENQQFKQLPNSVLTLSGQTQIVTTSGLTLLGTHSNAIPIVATGETDGYVLTYSAANNQIQLEVSSTSGGSTIYKCNSPTTCSVGGLNSGTAIYGCNLATIIELIVAPVVSPSCSPPYNTLSLSPSTSPLEIGCNIAFITNASFNEGTVSPIYCGGTSVRTGSPSVYNYVDTVGNTYNISSHALTNSISFAANTIYIGNNTATLNVCYAAGQYPFRSDGTTIGMTCCPAGVAPTVSQTIVGLYPYFYGVSIGLPVAGSALLAAGTKVVGYSNNNVTINFNAVSQYIWVAIPYTSPTFTSWCGSNAPATNTEPIPGGLFNAPTTVSVNSPSSCWSSQNYNFYISNYPTTTISSGTPYTLTFTN